MAQKPVIAIIGAAGKMGSALAEILPSSAQSLLLMDSDRAKIETLAETTREKFGGCAIEVISCAKEASWEADIIIMASADVHTRETIRKISDVATGKIVISVSDISESSVINVNESSAAEELQRLLPYSRIVKTFNVFFASEFVSAAIEKNAKDVFLAGNNGDAVETVSSLVKSLGFNPVAVGDLSVSRKLDQMIKQLSSKTIRNSIFTK